MKRLLLITTVSLLFFILGSAAWYVIKLKAAPGAARGTTSAGISTNNKVAEKLKSNAPAAFNFTSANHFNIHTCFFIDMSIESGKNRFFVYDMQKKVVLLTGLVTHGCCNQNWLQGRRYGNEVGCGCTSLGKYKVGNPYKGRFGLAYKLYGLDATNSNAFNRFVVLHSMGCVPTSEVYPYPICQSDGCPAVSPAFLKQLAAIIDGSNQPVLLWVFD